MVLPPRKSEAGIFREVWRQYNLLREYCASLRPCPGKNIRINHSSQGTMLSAEWSSAEGGTEIKTFQIKTAGIRDNDLLCVEWSGGLPGTEEFAIARPWTHRRYAWDTQTIDGVTYTYVTSQRRNAVGTVTEIHDIIPAYTVGAMIVAAKVSCVADPNLSWDWLDLNMDAREWARQVVA